MNRIKKGDNVIIIAGKDKGEISQVINVDVEKERVTVKGVNLVSKHVKPNPSKQINGGIVKIEASLHVSNVAHFNPNTKKADKIGFKFIKENEVMKKVRFYKSNNELVDGFNG